MWPLGFELFIVLVRLTTWFQRMYEVCESRVGFGFGFVFQCTNLSQISKSIFIYPTAELFVLVIIFQIMCQCLTEFVNFIIFRVHFKNLSRIIWSRVIIIIIELVIASTTSWGEMRSRLHAMYHGWKQFMSLVWVCRVSTITHIISCIAINLLVIVQIVILILFLALWSGYVGWARLLWIVTDVSYVLLSVLDLEDAMYIVGCIDNYAWSLYL